MNKLRISCQFVSGAMRYSTTIENRLQRKLQQLRSQFKPHTPCYLRVRRSEYKCLAHREINPSQPCSAEEEPCAQPIDVLAYRPSDKNDRCYQRTWCELKPMPQSKPRVRKIYPNPERRDPKAFHAKPCTACRIEDCQLPTSPRAPPPMLFKSTISKPMPCCRLRSLTCHSKGGKCGPYRPPSDCEKRPTPCLSFSECKTLPLSPPSAVSECDPRPSLCDMWNYYRTRR